jgi:Holliday junction resolvase-like predicted endonuclease
MPIFSRLIFTVVRWSACRGLRDSAAPAPPSQNQETQRDEQFERKEKARRRGLLGERYGCWYLRKQGYVFIAKSCMPQGAKGELDLVGYHGETIAFVEIRTRTVRDDISGLPELSVSYAKQSMLVRTAQLLNGPPFTIAPRALTYWLSTIFPLVRWKSGCTKRRLQPAVAPLWIVFSPMLL